MQQLIAPTQAEHHDRSFTFGRILKPLEPFKSKLTPLGGVLVAVEGDILRLGANSGGKHAFVPADRPTELENVKYARQQP